MDTKELARQTGIRWLVFLGTLGLTLAPAALGLSILPQLAELPRFFNVVWSWQILALAPGGIARIDYDGVVHLANTAWVFALALWMLVGLGFAWLLRRVGLGRVLLVALPAVLVTGWLGCVALAALGFAAYAGV